MAVAAFCSEIPLGIPVGIPLGMRAGLERFEFDSFGTDTDGDVPGSETFPFTESAFCTGSGRVRDTGRGPGGRQLAGRVGMGAGWDTGTAPANLCRSGLIGLTVFPGWSGRSGLHKCWLALSRVEHLK